MQDYNKSQLGDPAVRPLHGRVKGMYSLVVVQPKSGDHVTLLEPCDWDHGRAKTHDLVRNGVDPFDIRFVHRKSDQLETDGLPLRHASEALWWTHQDQVEFERERADKNG